MQVVMASEFGAPEVLVTREVPDPVPGADEVVVEVVAVDVLWVETMIRRGLAGEHFDVTPPYIPGGGVAGRVRRVGERVDPRWVGRGVVARTGASGGYAEQVVARADALVPIPDGLDLHTAAALAHDGPTALGLFEGLEVGPDDAVLVLGSSGGLGLVSVQLAQARGARVVAAARDEHKRARISRLGPDGLVDLGADDWIEQARAVLAGLGAGAGAEVVLDNVGGRIGETAFELVAPGGRFSAHGTPSGRFASIEGAEAERRGVTVRGIEHVQFSDSDVRRLLGRALAEAAAGRITPVVGQTFALADAAKAHAAIEERSVFGTSLLVT
jgi:NADPH:quinone reductase